ncbi:unnamed protein product [Effrenium voratum]|uniref:Uncharacterized protein n=1 Tax=Effrenium voratum TaxID=2562239 RepID=A0AA36JHT7_9DINO|nr:unnamed protein product [Effrenium voratum]
MDKKEVSGMLANLSYGAKMGDHHKQAFLAEWRALPHSCKEKQGLLSKFKLDKSCKWMVVHQETIEETNSSSLDTKDGYLNKFQLADLVKLPVESKEFEDFSTTLKSDHDWDEENPIERGFKKAGLARYHVEGFKDLKVENHTLKNSESLAATRQTTSTAGLGDALALQDKGQVQVKMEAEAGSGPPGSLQSKAGYRKSASRLGGPGCLLASEGERPQEGMAQGQGGDLAGQRSVQAEPGGQECPRDIARPQRSACRPVHGRAVQIH